MIYTPRIITDDIHDDVIKWFVSKVHYSYFIDRTIEDVSNYWTTQLLNEIHQQGLIKEYIKKFGDASDFDGEYDDEYQQPY